MATVNKFGLPQILRNIICILSMGFVFPHALMEEPDRKAALVKKQIEASQVQTKAV